jgi:hypothetical protein
LDNGLDPAPERGKKTSWETFLKSHWGAIAATDFFSVEVLTLKGLVRYLVLFVIDLKTRTVTIAGIVRTPNGDWVEQIARNLTDPDVGFLRCARYLIHDRDPLFTAGFKAMAGTRRPGRAAGRHPPAAPSPALAAAVGVSPSTGRRPDLGSWFPLGHPDPSAPRRHLLVARDRRGGGEGPIGKCGWAADAQAPVAWRTAATSRSRSSA